MPLFEPALPLRSSRLLSTPLPGSSLSPSFSAAFQSRHTLPFTPYNYFSYSHHPSNVHSHLSQPLPLLLPSRAPPDAFFQNVCELDLVFNFYKVYAILDEVFLAGEIEETSKNVVLDRLDYLEKLE
jgi:hypothetical protein